MAEEETFCKLRRSSHRCRTIAFLPRCLFTAAGLRLRSMTAGQISCSHETHSSQSERATALFRARCEVESVCVTTPVLHRESRCHTAVTLLHALRFLAYLGEGNQ